MALRDDPASIAPERAIVFEVAGSIADFYKAVQKIEGLEFLADEEAEFEPDEDFGIIDTRKGRKGELRTDKPVGGRLYLAMPDVAALRQLLSLWNRWENDQPLDYGFGAWAQIFGHLRILRPWGPEDRVPEDTVIYWREELERAPDEAVRTEIELWFHDVPEKRGGAFARLEAIVAEAGGRIIDHAVIPEIGYEGALTDLPAQEVARLVERQHVRLALCDDVMFLRPQSMAEFPVEVQEVEPGQEPEPSPGEELPPVAALFDGMPVQRHRLLDGRLDIDDPDGIEAMSVVGERTHGTEMASLILHGDRNLAGPPLLRPLHVRPVLYAPGGGARERTLDDHLLIDVIYRAVRRMKEGDEEGGATAPTAFLVNLSLGDENRPFSGPMSPWAKLLDFLADRYGILFLVSAGNIRHGLPVPTFANWTAFEDAPQDERETALLEALNAQKAHRTLLSPAEGLNGVTVGAWHEDAVPNPPPSRHVDPFAGPELPNISSALGLGHRKVVKPDLYMPGGREHVTFQTTGAGLVIRAAPAGRLYGLKAAVPDTGGALDKEGLTSGTSAATALATRAAQQLFEALMDRAGGSLHADIDPAFYAVAIKTLVIHRAKWGNKGQLLEQLYGPHGQGSYVPRRDNIARLLGYGRAAIEEAMECAPHRATLLGYGQIANGPDANLYRIPLPPSLESVTEPRAVAVTVAWFSPVNPRHQAYRRAKLEAGAVTPFEMALGVKWASDQPSDKSINRGTVFHARFAGDRAVAFVDDGHLLLQVWCREQAGTLDQTIRYGLAATIEAGEAVPVYQEIRTRLQIPAPVPP
jgi:Subtilase family